MNTGVTAPEPPASHGRADDTYGWVVVAGTFVVLFFGFGSAYSFGTFFDRFEADFGASRASVSLVFSIAAFLFFGLGAAFGPLSDRFGPRWIIAGGVIVVGAGLILASRATTLWHVNLAFGLGIGVGVGMAYVPAVGAVQKWFTRRRGLASGLAVAGIGAGTLCMPIIAGQLIDAIGWRQTYLVMGIATLVCGTLAAAVITAPREATAPPRGPARPRGGAGTSLATAVRSRPFLLIYAAYFLISFGNFVPLVHLVPYALDHGISKDTGVVLLGMIGVGSTLGRFVLGGVADRFGLQRSLALTFAGLGLSCLWWLASDKAWQLALFALWMGTCYGGFVALGPAVMADYFGVRNVSGIIGALYTGVGVCTLIGAPLAGLAFDLWQSYTLPIVVSAVAALTSGALVWMAEKPTSWRAGVGSEKIETAISGGSP